MSKMMEKIKSKIKNNKIKQSDIENIIAEGDFDEAEYTGLIEEFIKNGIEIIEEEDILTERREDNEIEPEIIKEKIISQDDSELGFNKDLIKQYFKDISQYPVLTPEEEMEAIKRYKEGDTAVEELLIISNLRLVVKVTLKYIKPGVYFLDLIQDGTIGLINAIKRFDPSKNYKLSTYATWWIKKEIIESLKEKLNFIKIPNYILLMYKKIIMVERELHNKNGKKPTDEELEKALNMKIDEINKMRHIVENKMIDLNPRGEDHEDEEIEFEDNTTEEEIDRELEEVNQKLRVGNMLQKIDSRERKIIEYYFGLTENGQKYTFKEIGEKLNLSSERVRILKERALKKLRYVGSKDVWRTDGTE